nr:hypothetical protein [Streptomyces sp. AC550_RSS872]
MDWILAAGLAAGLLIATVTAPVGVSGAVFLLPVQLSAFGVPNPAITPTNLLFNVVAGEYDAGQRAQHQAPGEVTVLGAVVAVAPQGAGAAPSSVSSPSPDSTSSGS